jgi:hypothetical protein
MYAEDIECTEDLVREVLWREEHVQGLNKTETQIEFMKRIDELIFETTEDTLRTVFSAWDIHKPFFSDPFSVHLLGMQIL